MNDLLHLVSKHASKWLSNMLVLWDLKINPPELNIRLHTALEGRGVFSSIAKFLNGAHRPLEIVKSSNSDDK